MRFWQLVLALGLAVQLPAVAQERRECGGDTPDWLLVTYIGHRRILNSEEDGIRTIDTPSKHSPMFIKVCDIRDVGILDTGETVISRYSSNENERLLNSYWKVLESPTQICAAMPTCNDARRAAP